MNNIRLFVVPSTFLLLSFAQNIPYIWIDFDYIHSNNVWENSEIVRNQTANDGDVYLDATYSTTTTADNSNNIVGVFQCDNQLNGDPFSTPHTAAYLPPVTFNEFSLEVIVKILSNDIKFYGYIIGIENTRDNIEGNAISYNEITGKTSQELNKIFPSNIAQNGWYATSTYWDSTKNEITLNNDEFYHIIVTQNADAVVSVFVNGVQYGVSYSASGGSKSDTSVRPIIKICGDDSGNIGFDGYIRAFALYTQAFTEQDALNACNAAAMTICSNSPNPTQQTTKSPTKSPIPACELGVDYYFEGFPAFASGDPHFRMWNGGRHDFMGTGNSNQQFYYMHPCKGKTRDQMPFTLSGRHIKWGHRSVTGLDYILLELFDANGDIYLVWLSSSIHSWTLKGPTTNTLYDINPGTSLQSNVELSVGQRFKILYIQTDSKGIDVTLTIGSCSLELYMKGSNNFIHGRYRMHYLQVKPPQCYKCHTCGLFGDFTTERVETSTFERIRTCSGGATTIQSGWKDYDDAYDVDGWSWERQYVLKHCSTRRRLKTSEYFDEYTFIVADDFEYVPACDPIIEEDTINACKIARDNQSTCCNTIGGEFCDRLQLFCETDACAAAGTNKSAMPFAVNELFTGAVELVCSLPDAATQLDPSNLVVVGKPTTEPTATPTVQPTKHTEILMNNAKRAYCLITIISSFIGLLSL